MASSSSSSLPSSSYKVSFSFAMSLKPEDEIGQFRGGTLCGIPERQKQTTVTRSYFKQICLPTGFTVVLESVLPPAYQGFEPWFPLGPESDWNLPEGISLSRLLLVASRRHVGCPMSLGLKTSEFYVSTQGNGNWGVGSHERGPPPPPNVMSPLVWDLLKCLS